MFHPCKNLLLCVGVLLLMTGCGQKGPLFLIKEQPTAPTISEKIETKTNTVNEERVDELTQQPKEVNNINAE
jgi:predicted small lipoprotein YifL